MPQLKAGSFSAAPLMELTYEVQLARSTSSIGTGMDTAQNWEIFNRHIRCDIHPLNDEMYFQQTGVENVATHVIHFFANEDIRPRDKVKFLSNRRIAGPIGSWYEITAVLEPSETIAFIRAYARITDEPEDIP